jgi:general secretion pathway protein C
MFGAKEADRAVDTTETAETQAPTSVGNLRLRGVIFDPAKGYEAAILEDMQSGLQELYRPGRKYGDVELKKVGPDWVVIKQGRNEVRLEIFLEKGPAVEKAEPRELPFGNPEKLTDSNDSLARPIGPGRWMVSRSIVSRHMGDLNYFLNNVLIKPHFTDGNPDGFLIASVKTGTPVRQLGFRRGDVIKKVNGVSVANPEDLVNMYRQVQQMESVTVDLERGGKPLNFTYTLK